MPDSQTVEPVAQYGTLPGYRPSVTSYDESFASQNNPRPHWSRVLRSFSKLEPSEIQQRSDDARRLLREHGVTYHVYRDARGTERPWELDLVPLLVAPAEWRHIEAGLIQRAHLLNRVLADIYGPQKLLHNGLLPAPVVHANPGFLRPCHGLEPAHDQHLTLLGVDLARSPDGQWMVLADRAQAPSGAGYALENRIVLSRLFPDEFRDCQVQRLACFFQELRSTLRALAPSGRDNPNVVLLTPGPYNETYFEHAFLARYLGITLAEAGDLAVREGGLYLKTLDGLQPVDVILRRVDANFCDPLELRSDSILGVPGLVHALRSKRLTIANTLGSGIVETPAILPFLPALCRHLLGEELRLPSVDTWWCGAADHRQLVQDRLDKLVIKRTLGHPTSEPVFGGELTQDQRATLLEQLAAAPERFVAQDQVPLSTAPVWVDGRFEPRPLVLRTYLVAHQGSYLVMPGGLTRVSRAENDPVVSMQSGGWSKDTWVLADGPVSQLSLLPPSTQSIRIERAAAEVPSRVADNLFWLGRYAERFESLLRILRGILTRLLGEASLEAGPELLAALRLLDWNGTAPKKTYEHVKVLDIEKEILSLVYKEGKPAGLRDLAMRVRHLTLAVRDRFSVDTWRILNQMDLHSRSRPGRLPGSDALALLNTLIGDLAAFSGMEMENMTRGLSWRFLDIGRRSERAVSLLAAVRATLLACKSGHTALEPLLEVADSSMTCRRRYLGQIHLASVLDLLLLDETNPRALAYQCEQLVDHVAKLPAAPNRAGSFTPLPPPVVPDVVAALRAADLFSLPVGWSQPGYDSLDVLLQGFERQFRILSDTLTRRYFSHSASRLG